VQPLALRTFRILVHNPESSLEPEVKRTAASSAILHAARGHASIIFMDLRSLLGHDYKYSTNLNTGSAATRLPPALRRIFHPLAVFWIVLKLNYFLESGRSVTPLLTDRLEAILFPRASNDRGNACTAVFLEA